MPAGKRALISVSDKTGIVDLARGLASLGYVILSTGGTAKALQEAGIPVEEIARYTGQPEILDGRVKTLHPKIHGGILADPTKPKHRDDLRRAGIEPIELVVVNLYPFREVARRPGAALEEVIEMIDIGGPALLRAAAKNHGTVGVVVDPSDYPRVLEEIGREGGLRPATRQALAVKAFAHTASYDAAIRDELARRTAAAGDPSPSQEAARAAAFAQSLTLAGRLTRPLRYGENPHQRGALYAEADAADGSIARARQIQGKELSFNNLLDLDAAWRLAAEFAPPAAVIIKHNNPCGAGTGATPAEAFEKARRTDPDSAFGGVVAFNCEVDTDAAAACAAIFLECVIAPSYAPPARRALAAKTGLRVMEAGEPGSMYQGLDVRRVTGGFLVQDWDVAGDDLARARVVTRRGPVAEEQRALEFAWRVAKHVKSNAIVLARADRTVGVGAGQMSRVDSVRLAVMKSLDSARGTALASDAFFPFRDGIDQAARAGVTAVVQPGGSIRDAEVIAAADEHSMAMLFTGIRHFRH
jgi:phosphoribosylaminoimidazolecarboxamide formyltransferase/IMP cyclohydrolase